MSEITIRLKGGPGSGHWGHRGIPGQRGGSLPGKGGVSNLSDVIPRANLGDLILEKDNSIVYARDSKTGNYAYRFMYNPSTGVLLAGDMDHASLHSRYGSRGRYDDYVKMETSYYGLKEGDIPGLNIFLDRHIAVDDAEAWDMAFAAARVMKRAGFPNDAELTFDYWTENKPYITVDMETV